MSENKEIMPVLAEILEQLEQLIKLQKEAQKKEERQWEVEESQLRVLLQIYSERMVEDLSTMVKRLENKVDKWQWLFPDIRGFISKFYAKSVNVILSIIVVLLIGTAGYAWHLYQEGKEWKSYAQKYEDNYFKWEYFSRKKPKIKWEGMSTQFAKEDTVNTLKKWVNETKRREYKIEDAKQRKAQAEKDLMEARGKNEK